MIQLTRCFGVSLALHLALASLFVLVVAREQRQPAKVVTVMLDFFEPPEISASRFTRTPAPVPVPVARPVAPPPAREPLRAKEVPPPRETVRQPAPAVPVPETSIRPAAPLAQAVAAPGPVVAPLRQVSAAEARAAVPAVPAARQTAGNAPQAVPRPALASAAPATAAPRPTAAQAQQRYLKEHFAYIRDLITTRLVYPPQARRMNWSGKTLVAFTVVEDGQVQALRVVESSGYALLDRSALETVASVAPFPRPPVRAEIVIPIQFKMM